MKSRFLLFCFLGALLVVCGRASSVRAAGYSVRVGDILVANYEGFSVIKIDPATKAQEPLGTFVLPADLALDSDGGLFVAEFEGVIQRLDLATGIVKTVLAAGSGPSSIFGIVLGPRRELYVTSADDNAVYRVDPETGTATMVSAQTNLVGVVGIDLLDPEHVVVSCSSGNVSQLVSVAIADGAQRVIASGGEMDQPWGVAVHGTNLFTTAYDSKRLLRVAGGLADVVAQTPGFPYGLAVHPEGNLVAGSKGNTDEIRVYAQDGTLLDAFSGGLIRLAAGIEVSRIQVDPAPAAVTLQSATALEAEFADVPASIDISQRTVQAARQPGDHFYRLRAGVATRLTEIQVTTDRVLLRWE